jgi:hypothetical protein
LKVVKSTPSKLGLVREPVLTSQVEVEVEQEIEVGLTHGSHVLTSQVEIERLFLYNGRLFFFGAFMFLSEAFFLLWANEFMLCLRLLSLIKKQLQRPKTLT